MAELPPIRRIVTDHDPHGKAIISSDIYLTVIDPHVILYAQPLPTSLNASSAPKMGGFTLVYRTTAFPALNTSP